jgi:uncharacterized membrane protein (DUF485 family)
MEQEQKHQAWGIASFVVAILSIILFLMPYFGLPLAIFSLVAYHMQKKKEESGLGTSGLILGIIGFIINFIMSIFVLLLLIMGAI